MRQYIVRPGDSPASIAATHAGCPKCSRDLLTVNDKPTVTYPNGFRTFRELREGEILNLPDKWFSEEFDVRPPAYFAALPYADGVTPSSLGDRAAGILGDYATFDSAIARAAATLTMDERSFNLAVEDVVSTLDQAVREADGSPNPGIAAYASAVHASTAWARQRNQELATALGAGDQAAASAARNEVQTALKTAVDSAQLALQAVYGAQQQATPPVSIPATTTAPTSVRALSSIDPCDLENAAFVCQAQSALGIHPDGKYGTDTATAARRLVPNVAAGCNPRPTWWAAAGQSSCPGVAPAEPYKSPAYGDELVVPVEKSGMSLGAIAGIALLGAGAVGGIVYLVSASDSAAPTRGPRRAPGRRSDYKYTIPPEPQEDE